MIVYWEASRLNHRESLRNPSEVGLPPVVFTAVALLFLSGFLPGGAVAQQWTIHQSQLTSQSSTPDLSLFTLLAESAPEKISFKSSQDSYAEDQGGDYLSQVAPSTQPTQLVLPRKTVKIGETFNLDIAVIAGSYLPWHFETRDIVGFTATVRFNASLLAVTDKLARGRIVEGFHYVTLSGDISARELLLGEPTVLGSLPVQAALGNDRSTAIEVVDFAWLAGDGQRITMQVEARPGVVHIDDAYSGRRTVDESLFASVEISPNPLTVESIISVSNIGSGSGHLRIYNLRGQLVRSYDVNVDEGRETFDVRIMRRDLTSGPYFCRLTVCGRTVVRTMIVE